MSKKATTKHGVTRKKQQQSMELQEKEKNESEKHIEKLIRKSTTLFFYKNNFIKTKALVLAKNL